MADNAATQSQALCKYCEKKVNKKVKCINCAAIFHKSCSARKTCCNKPEFQKEIQENGNEENEEGNGETLESLKSENMLLRDFNQELKQMNQLLKEKIHNLENDIAFLKGSAAGTPNEHHTVMEGNDVQQIRHLIAHEVQTYFSNNHRKEIPSIQIEDRKNRGKNPQQKNLNPDANTNKEQKMCTQTKDKNISKEMYTNNMLTLEEKQRQVMQDVINMGISDSEPQDKNKTMERRDIITKGNSETQLKPSYKEMLINKSKKTKTTQIGDGSTGDGLEGVQKRIWIFLSRVKLHVTVEKVQKYLSSKSIMMGRTFIVEELKLKRTQTKAFKIGIDYALKDEVYNPEFWPKGVGFSRYIFPKLNKDDQEQNWQGSSEMERNFQEQLETPTQN